MLKIRRPLGRLIFNMGIAIPGKTVFLIETAHWTPRFSTTTGCEYIDQLGSFILGDGSINDGYIRRNDMHLNQSGTNRLAKNFRLIVKDNIEDITKPRKTDKPKPKSGYRDNSPHDLGTQRKAVHREEMYILCTVPRPGNPGNLCNICELVCQLLVSKAGTSNYIQQIMLDVTICPCFVPAFGAQPSFVVLFISSICARVLYFAIALNLPVW